MSSRVQTKSNSLKIKEKGNSSPKLPAESEVVQVVDAPDMISPRLKRRVADEMPARHYIGKLESLNDVRGEMARVYRRMWGGQITLAQATKILYMLDKIRGAIQARLEYPNADRDERGTWTGVTFIGIDEKKWRSGAPATSSGAPPPAQQPQNRSIEGNE